LFGSLGLYLYGQLDDVPRDATARVTVEKFRSELLSEPLPGAVPRVSSIKVYPAHEGVQLITYDLASSGSEGITTTQHFLYIQTGGTDASDQFERTVASNGFRIQRVWWTGPPASTVIWLGGAVLFMGFSWPYVIQRLAAKGHGPKPLVAYQNSAPKLGEAKEHEPQAEQELLDESRQDGSAVELAVEAQTETKPVIAQSPPKKLSSEPLKALEEEKCIDDKDYRGEFYPVAQPRHTQNGFSLVELLVVIGILGLVLALLLPTLGKARGVSEQLVCATNLRSIGVAITIYVSENRGTYPAAYFYLGQKVNNGVDTSTPTAGYLHWSSYIYGSGAIPQSSFHCPALDRGGLPPTDTTPDNLEPGIASAEPGVVDQQVPRLAYTLNEALCPRNKLQKQFQGAMRVYQYVRATQVEDTTGTILATEWGPTAARIGDPASGAVEVVSHRPIHGFIGLDGTLDMHQLDLNTPFRRVTAADLDPDPASASTSATRLDWAGRNHGPRQGYPDRRRSNFLYADGHVETKSIYETLAPFQWGHQFYSLNPHDDLQMP
jgi:prepilin-type N-terminal cleavage/methylation domain-containing protein/prepilin-type processing-associated H-X9-DG protein